MALPKPRQAKDIKLEQYVKPTSFFISRTDETERLYKAEARLAEALKTSATEWAKLMQKHSTEHNGKVPHQWYEAIPQALFDLLEGFQTESSVIACIGFLEFHGYKVVPK